MTNAGALGGAAVAASDILRALPRRNPPEPLLPLLGLEALEADDAQR
jgi:hypothetical protein